MEGGGLLCTLGECSRQREHQCKDRVPGVPGTFKDLLGGMRGWSSGGEGEVGKSRFREGMGRSQGP